MALKTIALTIGLVMISLNASATLPLNDSLLGQPFDVVANGKKVSINTCQDLINVRQHLGKIAEVQVNLPNMGWNWLMDSMTACQFENQLRLINAHPVKDSALTLKEIVRHFPANLLPSPNPADYHQNIHKSIEQAFPDIKVTDDTASTVKGARNMRLMDQKTFKTKDGVKIKIVSIGTGVPGGTWSTKQIFILQNTGNKLWKVTQFDYNTVLNPVTLR